MSTMLPVEGSVPPQKDMGVLPRRRVPVAEPGTRMCGGRSGIAGDDGAACDAADGAR